MTNFIIEKLQHYDDETKKVDTYKHSLTQMNVYCTQGKKYCTWCMT